MLFHSISPPNRRATVNRAPPWAIISGVCVVRDPFRPPTVDTGKPYRELFAACFLADRAAVPMFFYNVLCRLFHCVTLSRLSPFPLPLWGLNLSFNRVFPTCTAFNITVQRLRLKGLFLPAATGYYLISGNMAAFSFVVQVPRNPGCGFFVFFPACALIG